VLRHLPGGPDGPVLPGQHSQLCMDCVSHAPLLVVAGGMAAALFLASLATGTLPIVVTDPSSNVPATTLFVRALLLVDRQFA